MKNVCKKGVLLALPVFAFLGIISNNSDSDDVWPLNVNEASADYRVEDNTYPPPPTTLPSEGVQGSC